MLQKITLYLLLLFAISGCDYELEKENYSNISPPDQTHTFELSLNPQTDTIKIFQRTYFTYNINTNGLKIQSGWFTLAGKKWGASSSTGGFGISPQEFKPGYDTLTLELTTNSGTGSIADIIRAEGYKVRHKWLVLIDNRPAPKLIPTKSVTKDGFLKLSWSKCDQYNFSRYTYEYMNNFKIVNKNVYNRDSTFIVDSSFVGGDISFRVSCVVKADDGQCTWGDFYRTFDSVPQIKVKEMGLDSLRLYWKRSPYHCKYWVEYSGLPGTTDTSMTIASPGFVGTVDYHLYVYPYKSSQATPQDQMTRVFYRLGKGITPQFSYYGYNQLDKAVYADSYDNALCLNVSDAVEQGEVSLKNLLYQGLFACPTNSTKVAALTSEKIYVFPDKSLQNPVIIPYPCWAVSIDHFYLCDNNIIAIAKPNKYELIKASDGSIFGSINIDDYPYYSKWACITTSKDCKYFCVATYNGLYLYSIASDGTITKIFTDSRSYRSAYFDTADPSKLMLTLGGSKTLEVRNVPDFSLIKTYNMETTLQVIQNVDPESGLLLITDYKMLYIYSLAKEQLLLKLKTNDYMTRLYNQRLYARNGYFLDISKYLSR
ncbi:MAG: hypothetical protein HXX16_16225 [Bacteroidales bacterium]|nr:hypothetical protein [Bacteroidales bacterium]